MKRCTHSRLAGLIGVVLALAALGGVAFAETSPLEGAVCPVPDAASREVVAPEHRGNREGARAPSPSPRAVSDRDLHFLRVGNVPVDRSSAWIPFIVRAREVGFTVHAAVRDRGFAVSIELNGPNGEPLACRGCPLPAAVGEEKISRGSVQVPSTDRPGGAILPGTYEFRVNALRIPDTSHDGETSTMADILVAFRSDAAPIVDRVIDLNFVYLPGIPLDAETASSTPEFAELLALSESELEPLGIRFGEVTHIDLARPEFTNLGSWEEAARMFLQTSNLVGRPRALNVYCVGIFEDDFLNAAGLSGGVPGPAVNGTRDSGIAMRIAPTYPNFLPAYAKLLAHEIGHYLGFYHTTEADLQDEDPLSDTPRCEGPDLHACPDWTNHMFPIVNADQVIWSPAQIGIARTHPIVRTIPIDGLGGSGTGALDPVADAARLGTELRARPNPFVDHVVLEGTGGPFEILDVRGRRIQMLLGAEHVSWDGHDADGRRVPAGIYFVRARGASEGAALRLIRIP